MYRMQGIVDKLSQDDARREWWEKMITHLESGDIDLMLTKLRAHNYDDDYEEQVMLVCGDIATSLLCLKR